MLHYSRKPHPIFVRYVENIIQDYDLTDMRYRLIFAAKCLGYLDGLFNKAQALSKRFPSRDYMHLRNKLIAMLPKGMNLH